MTYTYRTNLPSITIKADKDINHLSTKAGENVFSATSPYSGNVIEGTGQMTCTLDKPYISGNFPISSSATYTFTASGYEHTLTQTADIKIIPNSTVYRLHFRPITDDWENPHIYIYEPLYTPNGTEITIPSNPEGENAIQYGFTGKITFMGWTSQGGTVNNPVPSDKDKTGNKYQVGYEYDPEKTNTKIYNIDIDYCPSFRTDCCAGNAVNRKWPGVKMKPDDSNPGWFYFDLPVLAEPGKSLIMFANGHRGPGENQMTTSNVTATLPIWFPVCRFIILLTRTAGFYTTIPRMIKMNLLMTNQTLWTKSILYRTESIAYGVRLIIRVFTYGYQTEPFIQVGIMDLVN